MQVLRHAPRPACACSARKSLAAGTRDAGGGPTVNAVQPEGVEGIAPRDRGKHAGGRHRVARAESGLWRIGRIKVQSAAGPVERIVRPSGKCTSFSRPPPHFEMARTKLRGVANGGPIDPHGSNGRHCLLANDPIAQAEQLPALFTGGGDTHWLDCSQSAARAGHTGARWICS